MNQAITKNIPLLIAILFIFIISFYLSSQRKPLSEQQVSKQSNFSVKQKLAEDFETAFLKQYTPLIGCEDLNNLSKSSKCSQHIKQAKHDFKQQFIKNRGLPKETFEDLKLSFVD